MKEIRPLLHKKKGSLRGKKWNVIALGFSSTLEEGVGASSMGGGKKREESYKSFRGNSACIISGRRDF